MRPTSPIIVAVCAHLLFGASPAPGDPALQLAAAGARQALDRFGDPLPERAVSRLGTSRLVHRDYVTAAAFSPDGRRFASSSIDREVIVWEWPSGKRLHTFALLSRECHDLRFSPNGRYLAAWGDKGVRIWNLASGSQVAGDDAVFPPAFSVKGQRIAAWTRKGQSVCIHDLAAEKDLNTYFRRGRVLAHAFDPEDHLLVAEEDGRRLSLWDLTADKRLYQIDLRGDSPAWALFTPDAHRFAFQVRSEVTVISPHTGKELHRLPALPEGFAPSTLDREGKTVLLRGEKDATLQLWDLERGKHVCTFDTAAGAGSVRVGAFSPDGKLLATGGTNAPHAAIFWDTRTGKRAEVFTGHRSLVRSVAFSPDGKVVATCTSMRGDPTVRIWDPATGQLLRSFDAHRGGVCEVAFTPDGTRLVTCGMWRDEDVCVWDTQKLTKMLAMKGHRYGAGYLAVSSDSARVASVGKGTQPDDVAVWDLRTGKRLFAHERSGSSTGRVVFLPGDCTLAVHNHDGIRLWDFEAVGGPGERDLTREIGEYAAWSRDGKTVVTTASSGAATRLVEVVTGKEAWRDPDRFKGTAVAFAPNGRTFALGATDGTIRLFDRPTGRECLSVRAHASGTHILTFSPDGERLASVGGGVESNAVLIWDVADAVRRPPVAQGKAGPKELDTWCAALTSVDAAAAERAVWNLVGIPEQAVPKLKALALAAARPTRERILRWISELDDDKFAVREAATQELIRAGSAAEGPIQAALRKKPSLEQQRRLEQVLVEVQNPIRPEQLFAVRAVLVLEQIANPEARRLLDTLAKEEWPSRLAQEAKAAVGRLRSGN